RYGGRWSVVAGRGGPAGIVALVRAAVKRTTLGGPEKTGDTLPFRSGSTASVSNLGKAVGASKWPGRTEDLGPVWVEAPSAPGSAGDPVGCDPGWPDRSERSQPAGRLIT